MSNQCWRLELIQHMGDISQCTLYSRPYQETFGQARWKNHHHQNHAASAQSEGLLALWVRPLVPDSTQSRSLRLVPGHALNLRCAGSTEHSKNPIMHIDNWRSWQDEKATLLDFHFQFDRQPPSGHMSDCCNGDFRHTECKMPVSPGAHNNRVGQYHWNNDEHQSSNVIRILVWPWCAMQC